MAVDKKGQSKPGSAVPAAMMIVDVRHEGRPVVRCLIGAGPVAASYSSYGSEIARKIQLPCAEGILCALLGAPKWAEKRVCTMCTP